MIAHPLRFTILTVLSVASCLTGWAQAPSAADLATNELRRGDQALAARQYSDALQAFKNANRLDHDSCFTCCLRLSLTYVEMKNWRDAAEMADKALALATNDSQRARAHNFKGHAFLGQISQDPKKLQQAQEEYRAAVQADPTVPPFHFSLGMTLLKDSHDAEGIHELQRFVELAPQDPQTALAKQWIAEPRRARVMFAPDFHLTTAQGDDISLASLKGKIAVFDFWATWCPPCRAALPDLKDLVKEYPPDRFVLISVSVDEDEQAWRDYAEQNKMTWPQYYDSNSQLFRMFGLEDVPTYIILGGDGSILDRVEGTDPQNSIAYRLKDILAKRPELNPN